MIASVPEEQLLQRRGERWSASEIISHLMIAERLSLQYMKKKSRGIDQAGNTGVVENFRYFLLKVSQRLPLRYRAPALFGEGRPPSLQRRELVMQWDDLRADLALFLEGIADHHVNRKIYKHPFAGRLNAAQAVSFFREHAIHHFPQIRKLISDN